MRKWCKYGILGLFSLNVYAEEFNPNQPLNLNENEMAYFVSFSMPEPQLVSAIKSAEQLSIPVYLNGLVKNSMGATAKAMLYLAQKYNVQGVQVDPTRFTYYGIQSVPALVKKCGNKFDVIYGNVEIKHLLETIEREGECKK